MTDPMWALGELRAGVILIISSHKLGRTIMEIGSIVKAGQVAKGFYGESIDEEDFIYNGIKFHRSQKKA